MSDKPTTAEIITMLSEFNCHADVQKLASDRLEEAEAKITALEDEKADMQKILIAEYRYWRDQDNPDIGDIVIGATGAVSNVLVALHGHKPEHLNELLSKQGPE